MITITEREELIQKSKVRNVFVPSQPVSLESLLFGREDETKRLVGKLSTPGGHAILFGDRGVGKTSLSNIVRKHYEQLYGKGTTYIHRCNPQDSLISILKEPLDKHGVDVTVEQESKSHDQAGNAKIKITIAEGGIGSKRTNTKTIRPEHLNGAPSYIEKMLGRYKRLLIIDEVDVLRDSSVVWQLAILIKQLSDSGAEFKILLVGIARTIRQLLRGHKSAGRAVVEVKLNRLHEKELRGIVIEGGSRVGLAFDEDVILDIAYISAGYPYFTHLISLKCAEEAVTENRRVINQRHLKQALKLAANDAESSLRDVYQEATGYDPSSLHAKLLSAAVRCRSAEFTTKEWMTHYQRIKNDRIVIEDIKAAIKSMLGSQDDSIFEHVKNNVFRFHDPRMPSYILLAQEIENESN